MSLCQHYCHTTLPEHAIVLGWRIGWNDQYESVEADHNKLPVFDPITILDSEHSRSQYEAYLYPCLVMEVNIAYLLQAVVLRVVHHENDPFCDPGKVFGYFAPGVARIEPRATLRYIASEQYTRHKIKGFQLNPGEHTRKLQGLVNALVFSEVIQDAAMNEKPLYKFNAFLDSDEVQIVYEPIIRLLASERHGRVSCTDREEAARRTSQQDQAV